MTLESLITIGVAAASMLVALFSLVLTRKTVNALTHQYRDDHAYRRLQYSAQLINEWDSRIYSSRSILLARYSRHFNVPAPIPWLEIAKAQAEELDGRSKKEGQSDEAIGFSQEQLTAYDHMTRILNYFELVAHAVSYGVADERMLREFLRNPFYNWYKALHEFRQEMTNRRKYDPWAPVEGLFKLWYPDQAPLEIHVKTGTRL